MCTGSFQELLRTVSMPSGDVHSKQQTPISLPDKGNEKNNGANLPTTFFFQLLAVEY